MITYLASPVQLCCQEGGTCKQISLVCVGSARSAWATLGLPPLTVCVLLHCLGSRLLCWKLFEAGPGLYALPRSKPLRFRYWGTPQRHRLGWACVLCPSQVQAAQVTRCLASAVSDLSPPPSLLLGFLGVQSAHLLRCALCLFWGADLWLRPSRQMSTIQNPKKSWLATKSACSLVYDVSLGWQLPLSGSGCPRLPVISRGWASPQPASSAQSFVL